MFYFLKNEPRKQFLILFSLLRIYGCDQLVGGIHDIKSNELALTISQSANKNKKQQTTQD